MTKFGAGISARARGNNDPGGSWSRWDSPADAVLVLSADWGFVWNLVLENGVPIVAISDFGEL